MEMTLYEFILGLVGLFFVCIPALGLLFYTMFKESKKAEQHSKELKLYHQDVLGCLERIARNITLLRYVFNKPNDEEPK